LWKIGEVCFGRAGFAWIQAFCFNIDSFLEFCDGGGGGGDLGHGGKGRA